MVAKGHDEMIGKVFANQWEIIDVLGEGGVGSVYLAQHRAMETYAALKFLSQKLRNDPDSIERFKREVDVLKRSAHPNIGVIHDCDLTGENPFIVMEFLEGQILKEVLDESPERRLHPQRTRRIFIQILAALGAVHARGVIHRDLKPENVFLLQLGGGRGNRDVVKLIDFGIGKVQVNGTTTQPNLTQVGLVMGTPFYMSPEQCRGEPTIDGRTDLYAVGAMLYECVTGRLLFDKPTPAEIMVAHLNEHPAAPRMINPSLSPELERVIFRALAKKAERRYQTAEEMSEALETAIPEDLAFYRNDSHRVPTVASRAIATPPRIPTPADDEKPTAERIDPPRDVSRTPTKLLSGRRPAPGLALALTVTPSGLKREMLKVKMAAMVRKIAKSVWAWMAAMAWRIAKRLDPWLSKKRPPYARYFAALLVFIVALALSTIILPIGGGNANASSDTATTTGDQPDVHVPRDVIVIRVPVPMPTSPMRDAGTKVAADVGVDANDAREEPEAEVATEVSETVDEYMGLVTAAQHDTNLQRAITNLEKLTQDWPERYEAWEALGDALRLQRGQTERARTAYTRCLELIPPNALSKRAKVEGKIRGLK